MAQNLVPAPRGAARQIELKRRVNILKLGQLLGQLQAEGDREISVEQGTEDTQVILGRSKRKTNHTVAKNDNSNG